MSSRASVEALVQKATSFGDIPGLIQAAGVSPTQASPETILKVDLYGAALLLEEFGKVIARGPCWRHSGLDKSGRFFFSARARTRPWLSPDGASGDESRSPVCR